MDMKVRVKEGKRGYYGERRRREGEEFSLNKASDFSDEWMVKIDKFKTPVKKTRANDQIALSEIGKQTEKKLAMVTSDLEISQEALGEAEALIEELRIVIKELEAKTSNAGDQKDKVEEEKVKTEKESSEKSDKK